MDELTKLCTMKRLKSRHDDDDDSRVENEM